MADATPMTPAPTPTPAGVPPAQTPHPAAPQPVADQNKTALFAYVLGWITGIYFLMTEKTNAYVRFHAAQSIIVFGALTVLNILLSVIFTATGLYAIYSIVSLIVSLVALGLWILLMMKAYHGEHYKLPVAGDYAEKLAAGHPMLAASAAAPHPAAPATPAAPPAAPAPVAPRPPMAPPSAPTPPPAPPLAH